MSPPIENVPTWLVDWGLDEDDEDDEDDEPAVIREPEPDE